MCDTTYNFAQQGWQCPICKRVYSPTTAMCFYCGGDNKSTTTTGPVKTTEPITTPEDYPGTINLKGYPGTINIKGYPGIINSEYPNAIKVEYDNNNINKDVKSVDC